MAEKPLTIGVLMGGTSSERDVSLRSGAAVAAALEGRGYRVLRVDIASETGAELDGLDLDAAFIALHGRFGEDGGIQRILQERGIPYTGSGPEASRVAMDKIESKRLFRMRGVDTPPYWVMMRNDPLSLMERCARALGYPIILKPRAEGSSVGVTLHEDCSTLPQGAAECFLYGSVGLMEKFIRGREFTVGILDGECLPAIELKVRGQFFDFQAKYRDPGTVYVVDPPLSDIEKRRIQKAALSAHEALGCEGMSRVDLIMTPLGSVYVLEVNTIPGLTERSLFPKAARAAGLEFPDLCERILQTAFRHRKGAYWAAALL